MRKALFASMLFGSALTLSLTAPANADELRIGYIAPVTGHPGAGRRGHRSTASRCISTEHKSKLRRHATVKLIIAEDDQGKPGHGRARKAKRLILQRPCGDA